MILRIPHYTPSVPKVCLTLRRLVIPSKLLQDAIQTRYSSKALELVFPQSLEFWIRLQCIPKTAAEYRPFSAKFCREFGAAVHGWATLQQLERT